MSSSGPNAFESHRIGNRPVPATPQPAALRRRRAALIALQVSGGLLNTAGSGRGPWNIARSEALSVGLSNAHFKLLGLPTLVETR
jgi:hypothetical protein